MNAKYLFILNFSSYKSYDSINLLDPINSKFAEALQQEYKTFEHKIYPNECYYVQSEDNLSEMYQDIIGFLDRY